ncbi:MAG TPA: amino acid racemase [Terriglobales bacterium]|nr:amino acid racemase [Terriglobales bacterium]
MSKHIGIVGCSAEGAALCYRTICLEAEPLMGRHAHPEVTLHNICLADYMRHLSPIAAEDDWSAVAELMLRSVEKLKRAGAEFVICPDNTIHAALPYVLARSPLPWLHIAEEVGKEAERRGFRKLALTGTRYLVNSGVYPEKLQALGLEYVRPGEEQREKINSIIFDELVRGLQTAESLGYLQQVIAEMKSQGCDAVVLGCTEIPLLVSDATSPLPTLDSTRLLARAALREAVR